MLPDPTKLPSYDPSAAFEVKDPDGANYVHLGFDFAATAYSPTGSIRSSRDVDGMSAAGKDVLTISHSTTNESKPILTDRHLIRLDHTVHDDENALEVKSYVYVVVGQPRSNLVTALDMKKLYSSLALFLLGNSDFDGAAHLTLNADVFQRVLAGES